MSCFPQAGEEQTRLTAAQWTEVLVTAAAPVDEWSSALCERWQDELGKGRFTECAMWMQEEALRASARGNYAHQEEAAATVGATQIEWTWLPAKHVRTVHEAAMWMPPADQSAEELRWVCASTFMLLAFTSFGRPNTGTALQWEHMLVDDDEVTVVLDKEKGRNHLALKLKLPIPRRGVVQLWELLEL
ncbi:hypothetical protein CYMTET_7796 [Cymbomonas tetramitiformis]|uniref:Uncharacterized protein n=1 Tax=Cymbomonas tetramitiformis TaxID=36881 RepID=A0AAE0GW88_9CHLO|nr:hypothetical protein CYMTET_7796 [Cymbomonas tetramitiformis]